MTKTELARQMEDDFWNELSETGYIEALDLDMAGLDAKAMHQYGNTDAASTGGVLCDLIDEFIESISWGPYNDVDPMDDGDYAYDHWKDKQMEKKHGI